MGDEPRKPSDSHRVFEVQPWLALLDLAARQHDSVAAWQLRRRGFPDSLVSNWLRSGRLRRVHKGVYTPSSTALSREGRWMAAVLAAGPDAVLSHSSAAVLHCLLKYEKGIEVTRPGRCEIPGVITHQGRLAPDEITWVEGIPVTTAARTMIDLAAGQKQRTLGYALNQLELRQLYDSTGVQDLIPRHAGRRGIAKLRGLAPDRTVVNEGMEERFRDEADRRWWPQPEFNAPLALPGLYVLVDALWEEQKLAVELDSRTWHISTLQFEEDHRRDRALRRGGYLPLRITAAQWREGIEEVDECLRAAAMRRTSKTQR